MPLQIAPKRQRVVWNGSFFVQHSLALVNRELLLALLADPAFAGQFDVCIDHYEPPTLGTDSDPRFTELTSRLGDAPAEGQITIRHRWPPDFSAPRTGPLVLIQPWEFGSLPRLWPREIARNVTEVWVPSRFVRETYVRSGVPAEKVFVIPNGVNTARFHPGVTPYDFARNPATAAIRSDSCKFLYVGGTIARKGVDVLLDAYANAFTGRDPVTLIIKDFGTQSFYANQGAGALIRELQNRPGAPEIVYLTDDLTEAEIASLYAACDCLVHPYRGEGYGLPIAEAMACGKPALVTGSGAALDFANENNAYLIPAEITFLAEKRIGDMETVDHPFLAEPDRQALVGLLRRVAERRDEAAAVGARAAVEIAARHTWAAAAALARDRLQALATSRAGAGESFVLPMGLGNVGLSALTPEAARIQEGDAYEARKQEALQETRAGSWAQALVSLSACLEERPLDWDLLNAKAVALYRTGDITGSLAVLHRGVAGAPNPRDFRHNLAFVLLQCGRNVEALEHALAALRISPDNLDVRRTVERARDAVLKSSRGVLRRYSDRMRSRARRDPEYLMLQAKYRMADAALQNSAGFVPDLPMTESLPQATPATGSANLAGQQASVVPEPPASAQPAPSGKGPRLSLCMIVKNEERFLRNCLESVRGVVDEIVIVDTGSTDGTAEIARAYGAVLVSHDWNDDFSEARNISLTHATGEWALWLDADEEIDAESRGLFRSRIAEAPPNIGALMIKCRNWLQSIRPDPTTEMAVHHACRLFRRVPGVRFQGRIHEQNLRSLQELGYQYAMAPELVIDHFGYAPEVMSTRNKHARFLRMLQREVDECPDEAFRNFHLYNLGNAHFTAGDMENAAAYLGQAAENPSVEEEYTVSLFIELATALHRLGRSREGLEVCERADRIGIVQAGIEFARGYCLLHLERYREAEIAFRSALARGQEDTGLYAETGDSGVTGHKSRYGLALALVGQDRHPEALPICEETALEQPNFAEARYLLTILLDHFGRTLECCLELESLLQIAPNHEDALRDLGIKRYRLKDYAGALPTLRRYAALFPNDVETQGRLGHCCEEVGLLEEAQEVYERLRLLRPDSAEVQINLGRVLAAQGASEPAIDCFRRAIELNPGNGNAYFNAGDLLYGLGDYASAADVCHAGLTVAPEHAPGYFVLGNCCARTGAYEAAVLSYRQALLLNPDYEEARHNLALAEEWLRESLQAA